MSFLILMLIIMIVYAWWSNRLDFLGAIPVLLLGIAIGNAGHGAAILNMLGETVSGLALFTSQMVR